MNYIKITCGILIALSASRFIPHPPNFTSLIALSFYIPCIFGQRFIPAVIFSLFFTDIVISLHSTILFTYSSIILIGIISKHFKNSLTYRLSGAFIAAIIFYIFSNFGVWISGYYGYDLNGLVTCYILAIPFFTQTLISTFIFSFIIEILFSINLLKLKNITSNSN